MKIVVLSSRFPYPLEKGDKLRLYYQLKALSQHHDITLIALSEHPIPSEHMEPLQALCSQIYVLPLRKWRIPIHLCWGFLGGMPLHISYFYAPHLKRRIQHFIKKIQPEHIYCQLIRMAPYVMDLQVSKTLDYQDAFSVGMQRRAEKSLVGLKWLLRLEAKRLQRYEQQVFQTFDHCTIISEQDRNVLPFEAKNQVTIVPNGVDLAFFQPNSSFHKNYDLVFVGNMGYHPNVEAAKFLVKTILPIIKIHLPEIKLLIAGARPTVEVKNLESEYVHVSGWMDDIRIAYHTSKLFIAPLFLGSGQQNKILEAMACGLPCITTAQVNNAIGASVNETIFLAETAEHFAAFAVELLTNHALREKTGKQARAFAEDHFSWQSATYILEQLLSG